MAGHSKWANIQHRKNAQDAKRGKIFTKLIREITVAARVGDPDPNTNPRLRLAVDKAMAANMAKDTVERAIKRGSGAQQGDAFEAARYEGYGPGGAAVMVDCLTDNKNRTVSEVRHTFGKFGGNLGTDGSVSYLFIKQGVITFPVDSDEEKIMEVAIEAGADDVVNTEEGNIEVLVNSENFMTVRDAIVNSGFDFEHAEVTMRSTIGTDLNADDSESLLKMLDMLDELDDVQAVYTNADFDGSVLAKAS